MASKRHDSPAFVFQRDGVDYLKLCVDVSLYFVGTPLEHADGILDFYEQSLAVIQKDIVQYETGTMSRPRQVKNDTFDLLSSWVRNPRSKQDMMQLRLDNSTTADSAADRAFQFVYFDFYKAGALRLVLPADFVRASATPLVDLGRKLARKLVFSSGLGGYSLSWNQLGDFAGEAKAVIAPLSMRHPGVDIPDLAGDIEVVANGIKCINWLTFLDKRYVDRLGGIEELRSTLGKDVTVHPLPKGTVIQAGERPGLGDVNRRERLPLYRKVGSVLAGLRADGHMSFIPSAVDEDEATQKWLARFDK